ncbi:toprim domain-containing protein [Salinicoccus roseus]|uniref:toprim domain-containing protein n=1 Tax=Salinicoccus roseus TaxID=45670 RepID=UPI00352311A3
MSFPEDVLDLNAQGYKVKDNFQEQKPKKPYQYPSHYEVNDRTKTKNYPTNERKIHPKIVNWLDSKDLIAQDKRGNVVFKWKKQGEIVGADRQGTSPMKDGRMFKGIDRNRHGSAGFSVDIGKPHSIYLFESPIDTLSYWSIKKEKLQNTRLVSMSGLKRQTMIGEIKRMGKEGHKVNQITFCTDNDKAGREFANKYSAMIAKRLNKINISTAKDWNEELKSVKKKDSANIRQNSIVLGRSYA